MSLNLDRLIQNGSRFVARPFHHRDRQGYDVVTTVAKVSWQLDRHGIASRLNPQRSIRPQTEYWDTSGSESIRYPEDGGGERPGTSVVMLACVQPPEGASVASHDVTVRVHSQPNSLEKTVRAFGERPFVLRGKTLVAGQTMPLTRYPLRYELAFGGMDRETYDAVLEGRMTAEDLEPIKAVIYHGANPSGRGVSADPTKLEGTPAHQLECVGGQEPAGFGAIDVHWTARSQYSGTVDDDYMQRRHPVAPVDQDPRFECVGHPDLWSETPLVGDERIEIIGALPEQQFSFALPRLQPRISARVAGDESQLETHLDTIIIDLHDPQMRVVELLWRASVRLPKKSERLEWIRVHNQREDEATAA